jgi:hypothetical protein
MHSFKLRSVFVACAALILAGLVSSCNKQPIGPLAPDPVSPASYMSIAEFRALYTGTGGEMAVPAGTKKFRGVVISNSANEAAGNYRLQDESGRGIYLYTLVGSPVYALGTVLDIDASKGGILLIYQGDLELKSVPIANVVPVATTMTITPRIATTKNVVDSIQKWASTLVTINNVTIAKTSSNGTGQNYSITDATGTIVSFVRTASGIVLPEGGAGSITGYVSIFQSSPTSIPVVQLIVRSATDVVNGGQGGPPTGSTITLGTSPQVIDFNGIGTGILPAGVSVVTGASASNAGTAGSFTSTSTTSLWNKTAAGFKNFASATGLTQGADSTTQVNAANRALGVRQTSSTGYDPGAAFVFTIANTTGKNNLAMEFKLQSLDTSAVVTRTTTWSVDYALGDNPTAFTAVPAGNITGVLTTGNLVFSNNTVTVTLPAGVNNQSQKVWIRIVALTPTSGANNRPSTAIDDVKFTWN